MTSNGQIEAQSDGEQRQTLLATMEWFNAAWIMPLLSPLKKDIWPNRKPKRLYYYEHYGSPAHLTVRAIGEVSESYTGYRQERRDFKPHSAVVYDQRILS
jgi:hypothetical protein